MSVRHVKAAPQSAALLLIQLKTYEEESAFTDSGDLASASAHIWQQTHRKEKQTMPILLNFHFFFASFEDYFWVKL